MARRVGTSANLGEDDDVLTGLAFLQSLAGRGGSEDIDATGTSGEPKEFLSQVGVPKFEDVRQNQYVDSLSKIGQLRDVLGGNQDALGEEELEGLSGQMGAAQAAKKPQGGILNFLKESVTSPLQKVRDMERAERRVDVPTSGIPRTASGALIDPLEALRMRIQQDPSLLAELPEETQRKLAETPADMNRAFVPPGQEAPAPIPEPEEIPTQPNMPPEQRPGDELINPVLDEARAAEAVPIVPPDQPITEQMVQEYPDQQLQPGAVERVASDDQLMNDLVGLGNGDIPPEQMKMAQQWQEISQKRRDLLDAEERSLLTKAESGGLSTFEKIALGIAIAAPILIGLRYGGGAALAGLGEGLETFGKVNALQQKEGTDKIGRLQEIQKERAAEQEKSMDISKKILDSIPDKAARSFLKNKKVMKIGDRTGISTGDEGKALWLDASKFDTSDEGVKRAREVVKEADETIGVMKDSNRVVNDVLDIMDQIPQNTGVWEAMKKSVQGVTPVKGPEIEVRGPDGKVRKVDAFAQLKQKINLLQDLYNKQILGGTRLTGNVVTHWGGILGDPTSISAWLNQDLNAFKDTTRSLKDIMNSREVENLVGRGFLREPLERQFPFGSDQILQSESNLFDQMRQNPEAFKNKVK